LKQSSITLGIVKNLMSVQIEKVQYLDSNSWTITVQCLDSNSWTVTVQYLESNSWTVTVQYLDSNNRLSREYYM